MINDAIIKQKIYSVVRKYIKNDATVIWEKQAQARPQKPFCTLNLITGPIAEGHDVEQVTLGDEIEIVGQRILTLSVNYFGENAQQELGYLAGSFRFPTSRELFMKDAGLVFINEEGPRDLSALMENKFETRAQMDCRFRVLGSMKDTERGIIETVILENEIDNSSTEINSP